MGWSVYATVRSATISRSITLGVLSGESRRLIPRTLSALRLDFV